MQNNHNRKGDAFANLLTSSNADVHQMVSSFVQNVVTAAGAHITHPTLPPHPTAFQALWLATARLATVALEAENDPKLTLDAASDVYNLLITVCRYCGASLDAPTPADLTCPDCQADDLHHPVVAELIQFAQNE